MIAQPQQQGPRPEPADWEKDREAWNLPRPRKEAGSLGTPLDHERAVDDLDPRREPA